MGVIKSGILGGFSGKVGTVVGFNWKGKNVMRSLAASVSNPRSDGHVAQRTKFTIAILLLSMLNSVISKGWAAYAKGKTAINAAMSYTLKNAFDVNGELDYSKLLISRGSLEPVSVVPIEQPTPGTIEISWKTTSEFLVDSDIVNIVLVSEKEKNVFTQSPTFDNGADTLLLGKWGRGSKVHAYVYFTKQSTSKEIQIPAKKGISTSVYAGNVTVV